MGWGYLQKLLRSLHPIRLVSEGGKEGQWQYLFFYGQFNRRKSVLGLWQNWELLEFCFGDNRWHAVITTWKSTNFRKSSLSINSSFGLFRLSWLLTNYCRKRMLMFSYRLSYDISNFPFFKYNSNIILHHPSCFCSIFAYVFRGTSGK